MAIIKKRSISSVSVVYHYKREADGKDTVQWETYQTELEAMQRKAYIDYFQKIKDNDTLIRLAKEYKQAREALAPKKDAQDLSIEQPIRESEDNMSKTVAEFFEKWLPVHAGKQRLAPFTYDAINGNIKCHILPYFGSKIMNTITSEDVDEFLRYLSEKKCKGFKGYNKLPEDVPALSSATVKKVYDVLASAFPVAKEWGYITENPITKAPTVRYKKRKFWVREQVQDALNRIDDKLLHLAVHTAFMCSLRAGETMGIAVRSIDFKDGSLWITQTLQRVSEEALASIPKDEIVRIFPKQKDYAKSQLILKSPKTEDSERKLFINERLMEEIRLRIQDIEKAKAFFGSDYHDYGLLFSQPNGDPIETSLMERWFRGWQQLNNVDPVIDFQGLRKSSSMYKLRLSGFNYQEVQGDTGHTTPIVLMSHYNEALEFERRNLAVKIQDDFYPKPKVSQAFADSPDVVIGKLIEEVSGNPELLARLLQSLQDIKPVR